MPDGNAQPDTSQQVTAVLAQQLANENLGLRQENIRLNLEKDQLEAKVAEFESAQGADAPPEKSAKKK